MKPKMHAESICRVRMNKLLFLDFDGVLHPYFGPEESYFCRLDFLMEALGSNTKGLEVIISSSWRFHFPLDEILGYFPEAMQKLIAGATPEVEPGRHQRYREIRAYLSQYKKLPDWRALDDDIIGFPENCSQLIACDYRVGFDNSGAQRLQLWLEGKD